MTSSAEPKQTSDMTELFEVFEERQRLATDYINMLKRTGQASKRVATTYRCPRRCALLEVYSTMHGVILYLPRYKLSEQANRADSSEDGRRANTEDGNRHWKASAGFLVSGVDLPLNCDHRRTTVPSDSVTDAVNAGTREVIVK